MIVTYTTIIWTVISYYFNSIVVLLVRMSEKRLFMNRGKLKVISHYLMFD